jgi:hypothetical protein
MHAAGIGRRSTSVGPAAVVPSFHLEIIMKSVIGRAWMSLLVLFTCVTQAFAQASGEVVHAPSPTVSVFWVVMFLVLFVGICAWIGVAIWRNERKNRMIAEGKVEA